MNPSIIYEKLCVWCQKTKSIDNFWKCSGNIDGLSSTCIDCFNSMDLTPDKIYPQKELPKPASTLINKPVKVVRIKKIEKVCKLCGVSKRLNKFRVVRQNSDGRDTQCLECYTTNGSYSSDRDYYLVRKYGITYEKYLEMYNDQNSKCAICKKEFGLGTGNWDILYVDHNHQTDEVRGLLCRYCNYMLGNAKDNPDILQAGIEYLNKYSPKIS